MLFLDLSFFPLQQEVLSKAPLIMAGLVLCVFRFLESPRSHIFSLFRSFIELRKSNRSLSCDAILGWLGFLIFLLEKEGPWVNLREPHPARATSVKVSRGILNLFIVLFLFMACLLGRTL